MLLLLLLLLPLLFQLHGLAATAFEFDTSGYATLTHYDLPSDYIASCGCVGRSTRYPTAALNRQAFGSNTSFGLSCGLCFELRLVSTPLSPPPLGENQTGVWGDGIDFSDAQVQDGTAPNLVVKITDLCPGTGGPWCNATVLGNGTEQPNSLGSMVHFDLAWPSAGISNHFFPGDHDYGVWNVSYQAVSCDRWRGAQDRAALGSDWAQQDSACCPTDPAPSGVDPVCPDYYSTVGSDPALVPNTSNVLSRGARSSNSAPKPSSPPWLVTWAVPPLIATFAAAISGVWLS